ncbi:MAG: hypothetical protein KAT70_08135, partial [Thermoplasmata archaeon]|nr:hypothetical protein [Thermoplasmata archaeon]
MDKGQKRAKMAKGKMTECIASFFAILFIANVMFSGNAVARNNYVVEDLKDIMTLEDDRLVAPIIDNHWGEGLLISCSLEGSGL